MPEETFTETEIREALHRLPFDFTEEQIKPNVLTGGETGEVAGQLRMRQSVEFDLDDDRLGGRTKVEREFLARTHLRRYLAEHMAELVIACLKNDSDTISKYTAEGSEILNG